MKVRVPESVRGLLEQIGHLAEAQKVQAYAVGGCVRDWLLGLSETVDVDIAVEGDGVAFAQRLAQAFEGSIRVHPAFGTSTVMIRSDKLSLASSERYPRRQAQQGQARQRSSEPFRIDVATCRRETYAKPAAYPKVAPGTLKDDLSRRDFTINAMAVALAPRDFGRLIDPFQGAKDLRQKRLRILHARSFVDDPSRILRGIRFAHRFGLRWERKTEQAMREALAAGALGWLNAGRLRKERELMAHEPRPDACLRRLEALQQDAETHG